MANQTIKITKSTHSKIDQVDFDNIPFGLVVSDHMFEVDYSDGKWQEPVIKPIENLSLHPANLALHYGQSIFEGMKVSKGKDGQALLFRPMEHLVRINKSATRMDMPHFPADLFEEALHQLVAIDKQWIPEKEGSALYIRPLMFATDEFIGVRSSDNYKFLIFTMPVGPYYTKPVSLKVAQEYVRAAAGGVGEAKTAGNYAASLYPSKLAKKAGYDQVMWMDAKEFKYVQEVGTMNIFFVIDDTVITPELNGCILEGITRKSIIQLLREEGHKVEERKISIDEIIAAHNDGRLQEVFGSGTAAVISEVNRIGYLDKDYLLDETTFKIAKKAKKIITDLRSQKYEDKFGWIVPVKEYVYS